MAFIGQRAQYTSAGALGRNYTRCVLPSTVDECDTELLARAHSIIELLNVRDGLSTMPGFSMDDIIQAIEYMGCY